MTGIQRSFWPLSMSADTHTQPGRLVAALHAAQFPAAEAGADAEVDGAPLPGAGRRVEHGDRFVSGELVPGRLAALRPFRLPGRLDGRIRSTIQS